MRVDNCADKEHWIEPTLRCLFRASGRPTSPRHRALPFGPLTPEPGTADKVMTIDSSFGDVSP